MRRTDRNISDIRDMEDIISKADVCRIAFADNNVPYIVTMNFGYSAEDKRLYFHCANKGRKIDLIMKNNFVCFEMDIDHEIFTGSDACSWGMKYKSIVGYGNISVLITNEEKKTGLDSIMKHYGGEGEYSYDDKVFNRTTVLCLTISEMTGKKY